MIARPALGRRVAMAALAALLGAGLAGASAAGPAPSTVVIDDFAFAPAAITVPRGTTVTWINRDDDPHTVVSDGEPRLFRSPALDTGESFSYVFDKPGTYRYFCSVHPRMQGSVVVQ